MEFFTTMLTADGSELYMKKAEDYVKTGQELNFYELTEIVKRKQEIPLGYKKVKDGKMQLTLGPDKREKTVFTQEDYLIVIAED